MCVRPRLLFLITEDWYFWSHRLDLARAAKDAGFDVRIATRVQEHEERIRQEGFTLLSIRLLRRNRNPFLEFAALRELVTLYREQRPAIVHHVALKPMLYGSVAARVTGAPAVINAFAGLGYAFMDEKASLLRWFLEKALRLALSLGRSVVVFQNREDQSRLVRAGVVKEHRSRIIPGSGVDVRAFVPRPEAVGDLIVMLPSRMLWDKGVAEFVQAVRLLKQKKVVARFVLVGRCDEDNPASLSPQQLRQWEREGLIEWWGHREDMPEVLASAALVVLPSFREGLPKVLLEAASCEKALVATDVPGCREIVRHRVNGLLVPPRDARALSQAIELLLNDVELRTSLGRQGREIVVKEFSVELVVQQTLALYRELLRVPEIISPAKGQT